MSRVLTLDVDSSAIHILSGSAAKAGPPKLEKAASMPLALPLASGTAAEAGRSLKEFLKANGFAAGPVIACVGRDRVILKEIKFPDVPDTEEANVVRFQVAKELTEPADSVVIDYFPLEGLEPDGQKKALTVVLKKDFVEAVKSMCEAAGLKLQGIVPRSFALSGLMQKTFASGAVVPPQSVQAHYAVLTRGDKWGEMAIYKGTQVVFSRSLTGPALNSETAFLGEVKRNITVFGSQSPQSTVEGLYLPESDASGTWGGRLRAGLTIPVQPFDPLAGLAGAGNPQARGNFAGLVGAIALQANKGGLPVNFIAPRQPVVRADPNKRALMVVGTLFGLMLVGGLGFGYFAVQGKVKEAANLKKSKDDLIDAAEKSKRDRERAKAVADWRDNSVNWLDELYDLTARFPNVEGTQIEKLEFAPLAVAPGAKPSAGKPVGKIKLDVATEGSNEIDILMNKMRATGKYTVFKETKKFTAGRVRLYQLYVVSADVQAKAPAEYREKLDATPPPAKKSAGFDFGSFGGFGGNP